MAIKETEAFDHLFTSHYTQFCTDQLSDKVIRSYEVEFIKKARSFLDYRRILRFIDQTKVEPSEEQYHELARKMIAAVIEDMNKGLDGAHPNILIYAEEAITFGELHGLEHNLTIEAHMLLTELRTVAEYRQSVRLEKDAATVP